MSEPDVYCKRCLVWAMRDGDLFCSWCGYEVTQLLIRDRPVRLYVERHTHASVSVWLLTNLSPIPVSVQVVGHPDWLDVSLPGGAVESGEELRVTLGTDPDRMDAIPKGDVLVFKPVGAGGTFKEARVGVQVSLAPPEVTVRPLTTFTGRGSAKTELLIDAKTEVNIESLTFQPPLLSLDNPTPLEVTKIDEPQAFNVQLNLPENQTSQAQTVSYEMRLEGYDQPLSGTFELTVKRSATLFVVPSASELTREIIPGFEETLTITVNNNGEEALEIHGISVEAHNPQARIAVRLEKQEFLIEPGKQATVRLRVLADREVTPDSYFFTVGFRANDPVADHRHSRLSLKVVDEVYPNYIAFDFGTTDSAVAHFLMRELRPETLILEGRSDPKIYSNILFSDYNEQSNPPYDWMIGNIAKKLGPPNPERFVRAVKTKVGMPEKIKIDFKDRAVPVSRQLPPEEVAQFIMHDLLKLTWQSLRKRPAKVILSVPTRFTKRRSDLLKESFERAAQSLSLSLVRVETIDESVAAGLFYIMRRGRNDEMVRRKAAYTMMILDFGGGTTDITVFSVRQQLGPDGLAKRIEEVEVIGAWGDATLGGEEITNNIAELLAERLLGRPLDPRQDAALVKNLEERAEAVKLSISELLRLSQLPEEEFERAVEEPNLTLRQNLDLLEELSLEGSLRHFVEKYRANGRQIDIAAAEYLTSASVSEDDVVKIYEGKLRKLRHEVGLMLERIPALRQSPPAGDGATPKVDVLLLAGQSSRFPMVAQIFQDLSAQPPDFVRDKDGGPVLKECVAMGALYWRLGRKLDFQLKGQRRLWHSIGEIDLNSEVGSARFREFVPWGCEYPHVSAEIPCTDIEGNRVVLEVYENFSMNSEPNTDLYQKFELAVPPPADGEYLCRLVINGEGEVEAQCEVSSGDWQPMEKARR